MTYNKKYEWCSPDAKTDKEFLGFIYERLHRVFGDKFSLLHMQRLDSLIEKTDGIIPDRITKILEHNPTLKAQREAFRKALADLGHDEATCYSHWALEAFDKANNLRD